MKRTFDIGLARALVAVFCLLPAALWAQSNPAPEAEEAQRIAAVRKLADDAYAAKDVETGNQRLRELIEAYPGRWDIARPALEAILKASLRDGPDVWQEYAAVRLITAFRAGRILPTDPVLRDACGTLVALRGYQERFLQAKAELDVLAEATGIDVWVDFLEAVLSYQADAYDTESRFAKILPRISTDDNDPYVGLVWRGIYATDGNRPNPKFLENATRYQPGRLLPSSAPRNLYLKDCSASWQALRDLPVEAVSAQMHAMIGDALEQGRLVADDNTATVTWLWNLVDRHLLAGNPEARRPLRQTQQSELQKTRPTRPIEFFRRFPWTDEGQRALLDYGRQELALGRVDTALRSFRDVLSHASSPALLAEARGGLWVALSQQNNRDEFEAAFRDVKPDARYPWMGGTESAQTIRARLQANFPTFAATPPAPRLATLNRRLVRLPALAPWPASLQSYEQGLYWLYGKALMKSLPFAHVGMQLHDDGMLVSSPNIMAWYRADDPTTPVWQRTPRFTFSNSRRHPGNYLPPMVDNRVYARWGQVDGCPSDIAALDLRTGRQLWSTAQDSTWRNQRNRYRGTRHWPLNDPVYAGGRLYLLAAKMVDVCVGSEGVYLICMDPNTGTQLWNCKVSDEEIKGSYSWGPENATDPAIYGNAVTPCQGAVYCDTSGGIVARVDARDGQLEWAHRYPCNKNLPKERLRQLPAESEYPIAWGARPLVAGKQVIFMPRDHNGVFALEADTGRLVWQNALVHPAGAIGIFEEALLVYDHRTVVSIDLATGAARWFRPLEEGVFGGVTLIGSSIYIGTSGALYRLDARTGVTAERMAWNEKGRQILDFAILDNTLYLVSDEAVPTSGFEPVVPLKPPEAAATDQLKLPLRRAWQLTRANSQLYVPTPDAGLDGRVFLLSDGVLECLQLNPTPSVAWQRLVQPDLTGVRLARGMVVLSYPSRPVFLDGKTGVMQEPQFSSEACGLNDLPPLYRVTANGNWIDVVNNATGERLWQRGLSQLESGTARQAGKELHVVGLRSKGEPRDTLDVVCSLTNGEPVATYSVLNQSNAVPVRVAFGQKSCFLLVAQGKEKPTYVLYRYALDGKPAQPVPDCPPFTFGGIASMSVFAENGPYIALQIRGSVEGFRDHQTAVVILKEDDPSYVFVTGCSGKPDEAGVEPGFIRGDRYYDALPEKGVARIADLKRRKPLVNCAIPSWNAKYCRILKMLPAGDSLLVLWNLWELHIEAFDLMAGARKGSQALVDVDYTKWPERERNEGGMAGRGQWENEMIEGPGMLLITDKTGLQALVPAERADAARISQSFVKLYRRREPVTTDGSTEEWIRSEHVELPLDDKDKDRGSLMLAQDGRNLYLALSYKDACINPLRGSGRYTEGDWVSIAIKDGKDGPAQRNWKIGLDDRGRPVCLGRPNEDLAVGIGHNIQTSQHVYEIAVPLSRGRRGVKAELSAEVWDDRGPEGPVKILECAGMTIGLHSMTRVQEETGFAIMRDLPDLPASKALYNRIRGFYEAWTGEAPPYPASKGSADPARAVEDLNRFVSEVGGGQFPYALYRALARLGGAEALPPDVGQWFQRKREREAGIQGPYGLNDSLAVTNWVLLGYFPAPPGDDGFAADYLQGAGGEPRHVPDRKLEVETGRGNKAKWMPYNAPDSRVNFFDVERLGLVNREADAVIYAACWLKADADTDCELQVDTGDDWGKVYLDHEPLEEHWPSSWLPLEKSTYKIRLEEGLHLLLIKMAGTLRPPGAGHAALFYLSVRVTNPGGSRPPGITVWN